MDNVSFDMDRLMKDIENAFMIKAYLSLIPDKEGKELCCKMFRIFAKNDVSADKAIAIISDLNNLINDKDKE